MRALRNWPDLYLVSRSRIYGRGTSGAFSLAQKDWKIRQAHWSTPALPAPRLRLLWQHSRVGEVLGDAVVSGEPGLGAQEHQLDAIPANGRGAFSHRSEDKVRQKSSLQFLEDK